MEQKSAANITPVKRKPTKITFKASLVLCVLCLIVGGLFGRAFTSGNLKEAQSHIEELEFTMKDELAKAETKIKARDEKINELERELARSNQDLKEFQSQEAEESVAQEDTAAPAAEEEGAEPKEEKTSSNFLKKLISIALVIIIILCVLFAATIFLKKNDRDDEDDEDDDEDDIIITEAPFTDDEE